jgi:hypothetical protein
VNNTIPTMNVGESRGVSGSTNLKNDPLNMMTNTPLYTVDSSLSLSKVMQPNMPNNTNIGGNLSSQNTVAIPHDPFSQPFNPIQTKGSQITVTPTQNLTTVNQKTNQPYSQPPVTNVTSDTSELLLNDDPFSPSNSKPQNIYSSNNTAHPFDRLTHNKQQIDSKSGSKDIRSNPSSGPTQSNLKPAVNQILDPFDPNYKSVDPFKQNNVQSSNVKANNKKSKTEQKQSPDSIDLLGFDDNGQSNPLDLLQPAQSHIPTAIPIDSNHAITSDDNEDVFAQFQKVYNVDVRKNKTTAGKDPSRKTAKLLDDDELSSNDEYDSYDDADSSTPRSLGEQRQSSSTKPKGNAFCIIL